MYYLINDDPDRRYGEDEIDSLVEACIPDDYYESDTEAFDEYLDDEYGGLEIGGDRYWASRILYEMDESKYYDIQADWSRDHVDSMREDAEYEIQRLQPGHSTYIGDERVYAYEIEEEDDDPVPETDVEFVNRVVSEQFAKEQREAQENTRRADDFEALFQTIAK